MGSMMATVMVITVNQTRASEETILNLQILEMKADMEKVSITKSGLDSSTSYFKRLTLPIVALATAAGGPVGVIRISGVQLFFLQELVGVLPEPGTFKYRNLKVLDKVSQKSFVVDRALILFFKSPASFTGEDVLEIQLHGVSSVLDAVLSECIHLGALPALPGEFSFRAVLNSKMSLEEAEGIQTAFAMDNLGPYWASKLLGVRSSGQDGVGQRLGDALKSLVSLRGRVEAAIDFPEAETEQSAEISSALNFLELATREVSALVSSFDIFASSSKEPTFAIVGQSNVGKSTLLNVLSGGKKALVSPQPGTTRDVVESRVFLPGGLRVKILDTAGLRQNFDNLGGAHQEVEKEGIALGLEVASAATALIWVRSLEDINRGTENGYTAKAINKLGRPTIEIYSHQDRVGLKTLNGFDFVSDIKKTREYIENQIITLMRTKSLENPLELNQPDLLETMISLRQRAVLDLVLTELNFAKACLLGERPIEIACEHVRAAEGLLHKAIGVKAGDAYIGEIFSQFCLGK